MPSEYSSKEKQKGRYLRELPQDYCVIDIETTGLCHIKNEIIELSALKIQNNKIIDKYSSLVKPNTEIKSFITNLTGITNEMVSKERTIDFVIKEFCEFIGNMVVVGHNISFDLRFIDANCKKHLTHSFANDYCDTLKIARKSIPNLKSYKLAILAEHFGISTEGHHRGLADCEITFALIKEMLSIHQKEFAC